MADNISKLAIEISAKGGGASAAEVQKIIDAFKGVEKQHGAMKASFGQKLEHLGIQTVGKQMLQMVGIHGHFNPIIRTLQVGIAQLGGAFGAMAGPLGIFVLAAGAAYAAIQKLRDAQKKHAEDLERTIDAMQKASGSHQKTLDTIDKYEKAFGSITPTMRDLRTATQDLMRAEAELQVIRINEAIPAMVKEQKSRQEKIDGMRAEEVRLKELQAIQKAGASFEISSRNESAKETHNFAVELDGLNKKRLAEDVELKKVTASISEYRAQLAMITAMGKGMKMDEVWTKQAAAAEHSTQVVNKMNEAVVKMQEDALLHTKSGLSQSIFLAQKQTRDKIALIEKEVAEEKKAIQSSIMLQSQKNARIRELDNALATFKQTARNTEVMKTGEAWAKLLNAQTSVYDGIMSATSKVVNAMASEWGGAISRMIVDGERYKKNFGDIMKDVLRMFIESIIQMEIQWLAFMALTGGTGGVAGGAFSFFPKARAAGGVDVVDRPTMFLAGEAGAERVTVEPLHGFGQGGGAASSRAQGGNIGSININMSVSGAQDPRAIAAQVGREIIKTIRGMGQIDFRRTA